MRYLFTMLLLVVACFTARAQLYNAGLLHIGNGVILSSNGDFTNAAGADYSNDGSMYISGNIINDQPNLPAGTGTTFLTGLVAQTLGGAADFRTFSLSLNNSAGLTLTRRLAIGDGSGGTLTFLAGKITTGNNTQDIYFYPGAGHSGFDATHHVIGYVTKSGSTDFTFPIGDGTHKADLDLTSLSAAGGFQVLYTGSGYGTYNAAPPLNPQGVFQKEWWEIKEVTGAATAKITLKWDDARKALNHTDPLNLAVAHYTAGAWQSEGVGSGSPAGSSTGIVGPSNSVASFSPFTFGSTTVALPIVLGSFTVKDKDCQAGLTWNTQLEDNAAGFDVQQSADGASYSTLVYVSAKGTPSVYSISVPQSTRDAFYRIRMVDKDGSAVYSPVSGLRLNCLSNAESLDVYPNPQTTGVEASVRYTSPDARGEAVMQLIDMSGKIVYSAVVQVREGVNSYSLSTGSLAPGTYTLLITGNGWKSPHAYLLLRRN